ncbi:uncharacterized protein N7459_007945 [Penicillium hispanicum]|uniref:uncharacterized protein n=1 Tax=Penicillium hispanicum TaxID=1080232 RepID=UPI0025415B08|nr:uncharacterized protein N7459_007945 [Penicillium hispanicum]KAJ5573518.1 hypothetical protein N7459_007945 [Penicillium hispanicum]
MHLRIFISTAIALAASAVARPAATEDLQVAQLRLWDETGCVSSSQGSVEINASQISQCLVFDGTVKSVKYEFGLRSCDLQLFTDTGCQSEQAQGHAESCVGDSQYRSYKLACYELQDWW